MTESIAHGYDIIGDIHGYADKLEELLLALGYQQAGGTGEYRHPHRQVIFVGDLIDRGGQQLRTLQLVKAMVDAGSARIVMGNHEFNALAYHTEWPAGSGKYLRPHDDPDDKRSAKNMRQHRAFLEQVTGDERRMFLDWFTTIPVWLDLGDLRVVHACWHPESIAVIERECGTSTPFGKLENLVAASTKGDPLYDAVETLLKGPEISLVEHGQEPYHDKDGHSRNNARLQWWNSAGHTLRDLAEMGGNFTTADKKPYPPLPELELPEGRPSYVYSDHVPVFYGHYWRSDDPEHGHDWTDYTACVDFSAGKGGPLTAYRWSGEKQIKPDKYFRCGAESVTR
ncbi:metallophosphoesterase [Mycolicibacterium vaccae]|uniref:Ser/Thr protein phosphatase n=1 Tax=Mycolicibacterium vaccae ATCC 25954 TaxID=1194972 RepID=K0VM33_MYCVA|nr:metallophosphoesterase [Mycolicibacterium vaccae]EJZ12204.1 Ser/Thr protein phosphatase [Mycolicibacterium vaccae ATCC 25954]